jgi:uncharacterized repeat protein (TIGR01451 family)
MLPVPLERLTIETTAEPDFSVGTFRSEPSESVDVGEAIEWTLHVRNGGDGPARRVQISIEQPASLIYVPNSTTVNDVPVRDVGARSPIASDRGIVLNEVDPGIEATIAWRDVVHNGLPAGEAIVRVARIAYDGERIDEVVAPDLHVRAVPSFANTIPGLPFGVDGMLGPSFGGGGNRAITGERYVELPNATPVGDTRLVVQSAFADDLPAAIALDAGPRVGALIAFTPERLGRAMRVLDEAHVEGLVAHLFALRAFFPDAVGDARGGALATERDALRETLDRLFIKLRLPNYTIAERDLETPSSRATLDRFLHESAQARGTPAEPADATLVLRADVDADAVAEAAELVSDAPLASAAPWRALALLLPNSTPEAAAYRDGLLHALDGLRDAEPSEFLDALQRPVDPALDGALLSLRHACS